MNILNLNDSPNNRFRTNSRMSHLERLETLERSNRNTQGTLQGHLWNTEGKVVLLGLIESFIFGIFIVLRS